MMITFSVITISPSKALSFLEKNCGHQYNAHRDNTSTNRSLKIKWKRWIYREPGKHWKQINKFVKRIIIGNKIEV